ncbi:hypothetical protein NUH16_006433 [Penicillium rubens]|nr:hypothetical protein NUH16_006433 [Penicillium rubens]
MHGAMLQPEYDNIFTLGTVRDYEDADAPMISTSEGLFFEPWSRSFLVYGQWKRLSGDKNFQSCKNLQATHWGDDQCIWFRSSLNEVGYVRTNTNTIKDKRRDMLPAPVLLLPAGDSLCAEPLMIGEFAGHIWQSLFVADYNGSLTHLQQASDTGHWLQKPFYTYHSEGTHDVDGYTITIRPLQEDQSPLIGGLVQIRSSSAVTGYLNGRNVTLSPSPRWYLADFEGSLNFIVPTTSMACPILTIDGLQTATKTPLDVSRTVIDPSKKVEARWDEIIDSCQSWKDFKSFKLENGRTIFPQHEGPPDEDLQHGFDQFKTLQIARKRLHPDGTVAFFDGADGSVIPPPEGLFDILSDAWHYVTKMAHNVEHWFVESANEFLRFVCKIGNKVFKLVLDTVEKVMHAMSWVWKKLKTVIKDLINILGHIFNWKEIISTKNSISALLTSSIDLLAEKAGDAGERLSSKMSEAAKTMREGQARSDIGEKISSDSNPSLKGLSYNTSVAWMGERMKNGGMATMPQNEHGLTSHPEVTKCWNKTLPHVQSMQRHVNGLANKVNSNRAQKGSMTSGQTFTLLQEFAQPGVDTLKLIAGGMLDGLHALLQQISKYGNAKITIPVLSGLYKTIVGHDLTVFDAVSLILGFVTNAITSIVTGQAPPVIPDLQSSTTLGRLVGVYTPRLPAKAITDFHTLTGGLVVTCTILYRIVEYFKLLKQIATGGVKVSSGIGITDCLWAIFQGVYTIHSFPTDPDMPGMVFRGQICAFNIVKNVTHILAACMSGVSSKEESAAGEVAQGLGVDTFVVIVDTAVSAITSGLGILVGGFELDESTWKNFSIEGSTAGIVGCILNVVKDVSYFVLFIAPEEVVESVPGYFIWQGASDGLILVTCFKWRCDFDLDAKHLPHRVLSGQVGSRVHSLG